MKRKENMPALVYLGLWGINSRRTAMAFLWVCVVVGVVGIIGAFIYPKLLLLTVSFLSAAWFWYAIRWADKNAAWKD